MTKGNNGNYRRTILELVLVTGIFAIVSVFLLKFYLTADRLQGKAVAVSSALVKAESLVETVKAVGVERTAEQFQMESRDGLYVLKYDKNWNIVNDREKYQIVLQPLGMENGRIEAVVYAGEAGLVSDVLEGNAAKGELFCKLRAVSVGKH